jgi:hypothetical protein
MTNLQMNDNGIPELLGMLQSCRAAGSRQERRMIAEYIRPLHVSQDKAGNLWKVVGENPTIMWSCHTDTVHRSGGRQHLALDEQGRLVLAPKCKSNCLGADDTAGIWLACQLVQRQVPGLYIWHRSEECGGIGSSWIAKNNPGLLSGIKAAIALDRRGYTDVITHQAGGRCCSDKFAVSLAKQLPGKYEPSSFGLFTDTAHYTDLIAECTNISVGYDNAHSSSEWLDSGFLQRLRDSLAVLDPAALVIERKPGERDPVPAINWYDHYQGEFVLDETWRKPRMPSVWSRYNRKPYKFPDHVERQWPAIRREPQAHNLQAGA